MGYMEYIKMEGGTFPVTCFVGAETYYTLHIGYRTASITRTPGESEEAMKLRLVNSWYASHQAI